MSIVDRLRSGGEGERQYEREARIVLGGLLSEAADEIGRLRAELATTRLDERAKIVAWLRDRWAMSDFYLNHVEAREIAQYIEAGEHLK